MAATTPPPDARQPALVNGKEDDPSDAALGEMVEDAAASQPMATGAEVKRIKRRIDLRVTVMLALMYIANQLDRGNVSFAYISGMREELDYKESRYTTAVSVYFPFYILATPVATVLARKIGARLFMSGITFCFGLVVLGFGFTKTWKEQMGLRMLLGLFEGGFFPAAGFLVSMYYIRKEVASRMAFFYVVGLIFGGCGGLIAYGLAKMDGVDGRSGWRWIFIWEGVFTIAIAIIGWCLTVDFPEDAHRNWKFLKQRELDVVIDRVERDRSDAHVAPFNLKRYLMEGRDWKLWFFALNFLASSVITYTVQYFLPIILQSSLGFSHTLSLCLTAPVYVFAGIVSLVLSGISDRYLIRAHILLFNGIMQLVGVAVLGWASQPYVRYFGTYLLLAGTSSNAPLCVAYQANNVVGQWKRAFSSASIVGLGTIGGVVAPFGFDDRDAPEYYPGLYMCFGAISLGIISVCTTSTYMFIQNRKQAKGLLVIENTPGFRYTL